MVRRQEIESGSDAGDAPTSTDAAPTKGDGDGSPLRNYMVRAKDERGKSVVEIVQAASAQNAIDRMSASGHTDIELETDDFMRALPGAGGADVTGLPARDLLRSITLAPVAGLLYLFWIAYRAFLIPVGICVAAIVIRRACGSPWNWIDVIVGGCLLVPAALVLIHREGAMGQFRKIQREYARARFDRVLRLVDRFEKASWKHVKRELALSIVTEWRGRALVRTGKLDEALALVEKLRSQPGIAPAHYWHLRALMYATAKQNAKSLECYEEIARTEPGNPLGWMGMIDPLALRLGRPREARQCLERLQNLPQGRLTKEGTCYVEGQVLLAEGRFADARERFERYAPMLRAQVPSTPMSVGLLAVMHAQLAIACARSGDPTSALRYYRAALPFLTLHKMDELLSRCKRDLGV